MSPASVSISSKNSCERYPQMLTIIMLESFKLVVLALRINILNEDDHLRHMPKIWTAKASLDSFFPF
jgi:hypothetical protein